MKVMKMVAPGSVVMVLVLEVSVKTVVKLSLEGSRKSGSKVL